MNNYRTARASTIAFFLKEADARAARGETADSERAKRIAANLASDDYNGAAYADAAKYAAEYLAVVPSDLRAEAKRAEDEGAGKGSERRGFITIGSAASSPSAVDYAASRRAASEKEATYE